MKQLSYLLIRMTSDPRSQCGGKQSACFSGSGALPPKSIRARSTAFLGLGLNVFCYCPTPTRRISLSQVRRPQKKHFSTTANKLHTGEPIVFYPPKFLAVFPKNRHLVLIQHTKY